MLQRGDRHQLVEECVHAGILLSRFCMDRSLPKIVDTDDRNRQRTPTVTESWADCARPNYRMWTKLKLSLIRAPGVVGERANPGFFRHRIARSILVLRDRCMPGMPYGPSTGLASTSIAFNDDALLLWRARAVLVQPGLSDLSLL